MTDSHVFDEALSRAKKLCLEEKFDEALEIYRAILDSDIECAEALVGVLRVHSHNFIKYDGEQIEQDLLAIETLFPDLDHPEYEAYIDERELDGYDTPYPPNMNEYEYQKECEQIKEEMKRGLPTYHRLAYICKETNNYEQAANYYHRIISLKDNDYANYIEPVQKAYLELGTMYYKGLGVPLDKDKAKIYLEEGAKLGSSLCKMTLCIYFK